METVNAILVPGLGEKAPLYNCLYWLSLVSVQDVDIVVLDAFLKENSADPT